MMMMMMMMPTKFHTLVDPSLVISRSIQTADQIELERSESLYSSRNLMGNIRIRTCESISPCDSMGDRRMIVCRIAGRNALSCCLFITWQQRIELSYIPRRPWSNRRGYTWFHSQRRGLRRGVLVIDRCMFSFVGYIRGKGTTWGISQLYSASAHCCISSWFALLLSMSPSDREFTVNSVCNGVV
jgi:hypothetical protein